MKLPGKILSIVLALSLALCGCASLVAVAAENEEARYYPSIVIPGVFQSEVKYLDDDGNEMLNSKGEPYKAPFFLEDTSDIVKDALQNALIPIASLLISQEDKDSRAAKAIAGVLGRALAGHIKCDENGHFEKNIVATKYTTSVANLSEYDQNYALDKIPLYDYANIAGKENLYFFSYASLGNIYEIATELFDLIQIAKEETGSDKVNLAPVSQGGSLFNALMQIYKDRGIPLSRDVHRVCFIVPAADGTAILGDIFHYGLLDDDEALYGYMFPSLLGEDDWLSYLITLLLRIMPNADVNNIIDVAAHDLIEDWLEYSTCLWALTPAKDYEACREMYLMDDDNAVIREQTDWYHNAQVNAKAYISEALADGVEFFDIVDYNYPLYHICDSWDKVNGDGVIHTDSESFGAYSKGVDVPLGDDYVPQNPVCTDPTHNHIDPLGVLDASTGLLPETTFYFCGQNHERTADNDVIIALATRILSDVNFKDIYSDPTFPQFSYGRNGRRMQRLYNAWKDYDTSALPEAQAKELTEALAGAKAALENTTMKTEDFTAAYDRLDNITYEISNGGPKPAPEQPNRFVKLLQDLLILFSRIISVLFGGKGIVDMIPQR